MDKKIVLVTGENRGIGFEFCSQLGKKGYVVILTYRDPDKGKKAVFALGEENIETYFGRLDVID